MKLTGKQTAFKDEYCRNSQNGTAAARIAGYKGNTNQLGQRAHELVNNSKVKDEIDKQLAEIKAENIANRQQRQQFWTSMMSDENASNGDKLRASELLGRSEADFTDNIKRTDDSASPLDEAERQALVDLSRSYKVKLAKEIG